jgi:hypothetical protein
MWRLKFPLFTLKLARHFGATLLSLLLLKLRIGKFALANFLLTLLLVGLSGALLWLPTSPLALEPELAINLSNSQEVTPLSLTIKTADLATILSQYHTKVLDQALVPQADYVNLAILAHRAKEYELASEYLQSAQYINPNRDFFVY